MKPATPQSGEEDKGGEKVGLDKVETNVTTSGTLLAYFSCSLETVVDSLGVETGVTRYVYVGKHSEGNRFIRDKSL
jgi:hypothetical protein